MISKDTFQTILINYITSDLYIMQVHQSRFAKKLKENESFQDQYDELCQQLTQQKDFVEVEFTFEVDPHDFSSVELALDNKLDDVEHQLLQCQNDTIYALSRRPPKTIELYCNVKCRFHSGSNDGYDLRMQYQFIVNHTLSDKQTELNDVGKLVYVRNNSLYPLNLKTTNERKWLTTEYLPLLMAIDDEKTYDAVANQLLTSWYQDYLEFCDYYKVHDERFTSAPANQLVTNDGMRRFNQLLMNLTKVACAIEPDDQSAVPWEIALKHLKDSVAKNQNQLIQCVEQAIKNKAIPIHRSTITMREKEVTHHYSFANLFFKGDK